ncbi:hypothetical protein BH11PSE2_BH11PSE2_01560 [soil metagenome]
MTSKTAEELIEEVLADSDDRDDDQVTAAFELLSAFNKGFPIDNLGRLFASGSVAVRCSAIFISTELQVPPRKFMRELAGCLDIDVPRARHDAIQALSNCSTWEDGWAIAAILLKLEDTYPSVRKCVVDEIRTLPREQLEAGLRFLHRTQPDSIYATFLWAHHRIERGQLDELRKLIRHEDPVARRFGVGLALRPRLVVDETFVSVARDGADEEVLALIKDGADHILPPWAIRSTAFKADS